jgi:hypothetical protein
MLGKIEGTETPATDFKSILRGLLIAASRELISLSNALAMPLPMLASATRNLLELLIWTKYVLNSKDYAERFAKDWLLDAVDILTALQDWHISTGGKPDELSSNINILQGLEKQRVEWGLTNERFLHVGRIARELGFREEYELCFSICSKLIHPTSWSILSMEKKLDERGMRLVMLFRAVYYAGRLYCFIDDHIDSRGLVPNG